MKYLLIVFILTTLNLSAAAQIYDVFLNKKYEISTYVLKFEPENASVNPNLEIDQDKNENKNDGWLNIEDQLYKLAVKPLTNELDYFRIYSRAQKMTDLIERKLEKEDPYDLNETKKIFLEDIDIRLVNVSNNFGTYVIVYDFGEVAVHDFYLADFARNKCTPIGKIPSEIQVKVLREITQSSIETLFLIRTGKLDIRNVERIKAVLYGQEKSNAIERKLMYKEALVYPYFNGLVVEFPECSESSDLFGLDAFRIVVKGAQLTKLLSVYPEFIPVFSRTAAPSSTRVQEILSMDELFDLSEFRSTPRDLKLLNIPNIVPDNSRVFSMTVSTFQLMDTIKSFRGSQKYFFDKSGKVVRKESRDDQKNVVEEKVFAYNTRNQLEYDYDRRYETSLSFYTYLNNFIDYVDHIQVSVYSTSHENDYRETDMNQYHFVYSGNHRYRFNFNTIGELTAHHYIEHRELSTGKYCANNCCLLIDDQFKVIAIQDSRNAIDVRVNDKNQPLELYIDNDRHSYHFEYDKKSRISNYYETEFGKKISNVSYLYSENKSTPLVIKDSRHQTHLVFEIELEFWDN